MNTRFILPAAVAIALHAFALFGFRPSTARPLSPPLAFFSRTLQPMPPDDPPAPEPSDEDKAVTPRGSPDLPPDIEPPPLATDDRQQITFPTEWLRPGPIHPSPVMPSGPIGDATGMDHSGPGLYDATKLDNPPRTQLQVAPVYPFEASHDGRRGDVLVRFTVDEAGRVMNPHVVRSTDPVFEAPTLQAVAKWRFEPGRRNGRAVRFQMAVPVQFTVNP